MQELALLCHRCCNSVSVRSLVRRPSTWRAWRRHLNTSTRAHADELLSNTYTRRARPPGPAPVSSMKRSQPAVSRSQPSTPSSPGAAPASRALALLNAWETAPESFNVFADQALDSLQREIRGEAVSGGLSGSGLANLIGAVSYLEAWTHPVLQCALHPRVLRSRDFAAQDASLLWHAHVSMSLRPFVRASLPSDVSAWCRDRANDTPAELKYAYDVMSLTLMRTGMVPYEYRLQDMSTGYLLWIVAARHVHTHTHTHAHTHGHAAGATPAAGRPAMGSLALIHSRAASASSTHRRRTVLVVDGEWNLPPGVHTAYDPRYAGQNDGRCEMRQNLSLSGRLQDRNLRECGFDVLHVTSEERLRLLGHASAARMDVDRREQTKARTRDVPREYAESVEELLRAMLL